MGLAYDVPEYKRIRVIIDSDAACEADDPFAIAHALMSKKLEVRAIFAEHFGAFGTVKKSYEEIKTIVSAMKIDVPILMGEDEKLPRIPKGELSPAAKYLIEEAKREDKKPLYVLCLGAITNVASAIRECPEIIGRMTVVWIGGQSLENPNPYFREFNSGNDIEAANFVLSSGVQLWLIPFPVYSTMHIGLAEIQRRIYPCGEIGRHLFENMISYNCSEFAGWTAGESWSLGDSPAVGVALDPNCGSYEYIAAPIIREDTTYEEILPEKRPQIRVYKSINSRFILEDFITKLELIYGGLEG